MALPSGTVTFLFTDIQGSTRLWEKHPQAMRLALARHDALLRAVIGCHDGYVFKTMGDAFCAAFHTAPAALRAALEAQQSLHAEPWSLPEGASLRARMALHTGAAELRDNDYFGQSLNRAARLLATGHGGQILVSDIASDLCRDAVPPEVSFQDLGAHRLRDLSRPERVFQVRHPTLPADFPPIKSLNSAGLPNNLPTQLTSFIGREKEIGEVKALLAKTRMLTLTGSGGCGKTRLALQAASEALEEFSDGVWLVELAPLADPDLVPQTVALALGVAEQPGKSFTQALIESLKAKTVLLVLDNCEHLLNACARLVDALLRTCAGVTVLASSREALGIAGEWTYRVPSLSLPDAHQGVTAASVIQCEAVRLFVERAQLNRAEFALTEQNAPALASICQRLDGIPLALELAAARVRSLSVEEINSRLDNRFRLLTGGSKTALPRQQTLRALVDWSYGLLSAQEKSLLVRLSVFAGGWTLAAAERVCAGEGAAEEDYEEWEVLDLLTSLADKSLVITEEQNGTVRYRFLETVRQYARDRLAEGEAGLPVRGRHRDHFLSVAEEAAPKLRGSEQAQWLSTLEEEHDNLRQALTFCLEEHEGAEKGLRLGASLRLFWAIRGYLAEGRERLTALLALPEAMTRSQAFADALNGAGTLARMQGDYDAARSLLEESLDIRQELGDRLGVAWCLNSLGAVASEQGSYVSAQSRCRECLAVFRELGDRRGISYSLHDLGLVAVAQGDYASAGPLYAECLALFRELGDRRGAAFSLNSLGTMAYEQGDPASARSLFEESLAIRREVGDKGGIAVCLINLGVAALEQENCDSARSLLEESLALGRELGDRNVIAWCLNCLGNAALAQGDLASARARSAESLAIRRELGDRQGVAECLESFAALATHEGNGERSALLWGAAEALREAIGSPLAPSARPKYEHQAAAAREALGAAAFATAWEAGRVLTMEQAAQTALGVTG